MLIAMVGSGAQVTVKVLADLLSLLIPLGSGARGILAFAVVARNGTVVRELGICEGLPGAAAYLVAKRRTEAARAAKNFMVFRSREGDIGLNDWSISKCDVSMTGEYCVGLP